MRIHAANSQDRNEGACQQPQRASGFPQNSDLKRILPYALLLTGALLFPSLTVPAADVAALQTFQGVCDASAGVDAGDGCFWAAGDEENVLRLFNPAEGAVAVRTLALDGFLQVTKNSPEADLEGAARIGDTVYWITSHGRNKDGKFRENRHRFFATRLDGTGKDSVLQPVGVPYSKLLADLTGAPALQRFHFAEAARRAPKSDDALNIEALAARPDGSLWLGFRNPVPQGRALLLPLLNPAEVVQGARAMFGDPVELDLAGQGFRDMLAADDGWWIIAGPTNGGGASHLYHWPGVGAEPRRRESVWPGTFNPEALLSSSRGADPQLLVLSDDGAVERNGVPCKELPEAQRGFRALWMDRP